MVNDDSPIKDFYPEEFEADLNGKMQEWEAVVLIPFIDEVRMSLYRTVFLNIFFCLFNCFCNYS